MAEANVTVTFEIGDPDVAVWQRLLGAPKRLSRSSVDPRVQCFSGMQIHQSGLIPFGEFMYLGEERRLMIPRTRPTLRFPLTESVALREGIRPWYWDVGSWPFRESVAPREYLTWIGLL